MDKNVILRGTVVTGLGKGRYFMSAKEYKDQFISKLGIDPYHGTLNLRVDAASASELSMLKSSYGIIIEGFSREGKVFGAVKAFEASLSGVRCALVIPEKTSHTDVFELVANKNLREELSLKDGDIVEVSVSTQ